MATKKGSISVDTQSLFPIIKKWLYSEHDIFLRELVSNAHDAILKLEKLSDLGQYKGTVPAGLINIVIDKDKKQLIFHDNGLGMTEEEVDKYINQIAFSGAKDFLEKYENSNDAGIIGHFGMGFFSSFMVSTVVEIETLSYQEGSKSVQWTCDGSTSYEMKSGKRKEIGTTITLHLNEESLEYLEANKVKELVKKYSNYLPLEIQVNGEKVNEGNGIWNENSKDLKDEDYNKLFNTLFPYEQDPLFHIHFNIDYPFALKGIIYFPRYRSDFDPNKKGRIQLYCNNVFVSDNIIDIIPNYLNLLQGVIDSSDIPLNVSRSSLQKDANVIKMGKHIANKALEHLSGILKKDRKKYEEYWQDIHTFVKFGCLSDEEFYDKMKEALLFKTVGDQLVTLAEYAEKNTALKGKVLYTTDTQKQSAYIEECKTRGLDILIMNHPLDNHVMQHTEHKNKDTRFSRVDAEPIDTLLNEELSKDNSSNEVYKDALEKAKTILNDSTLDIKVKPLENNKNFAILTVSEQMRRFSEMAKMMGNPLETHNGMPNLAGNTLYLNKSHPMFEKFDRLSKDDKSKEKYEKLLTHTYKIAKLQAGVLEGKELIEFTQEMYKNLDNEIS